MKLSKLALVSAFISSAAHAEIQNLNELKQSFEPLKAQYTAYWDRAAQMKLTYVQPANEITADVCVSYANKIAAQYKYSPFQVVFKEGSSYFDFCQPGGYGGTYAPEHIFFQQVSIKNQFGLPIAYVMQTRSHYVNSSLTTLYLDANYKIVETGVLVSRSQTAEQDSFEGDVQSVDVSGNFFSNSYQPSPQQALWSRQAYSSADGQIPSAVRLVRPRRSDKGSETVEVQIYQKTATPDWNSFDLVITHADLGGGFYQYGAALYHSPASYNYMDVTSIGGQPVCVEGSIWRNHDVTSFAADTPAAESGYCGNTW